jgi:hypothetical protein
MERWEEVLELTKKIGSYCTWKDNRYGDVYSRVFMFELKSMCDVCYEVVEETITSRMHIRKYAKAFSVGFGVVANLDRTYQVPDDGTLNGLPTGLAAASALEWLEGAIMRGTWKL